MKVAVKVWFALTLSFLSISAYAAQDHYAIIVDAGSTGSRFHLFKYQTDSAVPVIEDIFSESVKPGLSSFATHPADAGASFQKALTDVTQVLQTKGIEPRTVTLSVLATAGMRLVQQQNPQTEKAIFTSVKNYVKSHSAFSIGKVETISGQMEALYGWLDVNYLLKNFQTHQPTSGSIDMGGASTQIAFATTDRSRSADEVTLTIGGQNYTVFGKSFLGLGIDQVRDAMMAQGGESASSCYPQHYAFSSNKVGNFSAPTCNRIYTDIIDQHHVAQEIISAAGQPFVAYSGMYFTYNFLDADKQPDQATFRAHLDQVCSTTWEQLKVEYQDNRDDKNKVADQYLATYCANGVYLDQLIYNTYQLTGTQLNITTQINQQGLDWTLGAMLYKLIQ